MSDTELLSLGLTKDLFAVTAAVDNDWRRGKVEVQINRLKTLKAPDYDRAWFSTAPGTRFSFIATSHLSPAP